MTGRSGWWMSAIAAAALAPLVGCTGVIGAGGETPGADPGDGAVASVDAGAGAQPTAVPLARLTSVQYITTVRDLFAPIAIPDVALPPDPAIDGFDNVSAAQTPSPALIEAYQVAAVTVVSAAMADPKALLGCAPASRADEDACASAFLGRFGGRAYRRPLAPDVLAALTGFYASARAGGADFTTAMSSTLQAMLQSPRFLYRIELGTPVPGNTGAVALDGYEMASRLSYLFWNTMPDDALFAAAATTELSTPEGIEKHARRLLGDPRAHDAVVRFHQQWLRFDKMQNLVKDTTMFPTFGAATISALQDSANKYVDSIFFGAGSLGALLTDDHAFVNDALAPIDGVPSPGPSLPLVQVDGAQRSGILTHAGLMAGFAHDTADSPVVRGVFVLDRLLCMPPPPPPPNIPPAPPPSQTNPKTTRDRFAQLHENGVCAGCHHTIDGIGFAFEHYDAVGAWRTQDMGFPVDATGWFNAAPGTNWTFDGAVDLGKKLAQSKLVQACVASHWMRYALGVDAASLDATKVGPVVDAFVAKNLDMRELLVAIVKNDAFRTRVVGP